VRRVTYQEDESLLAGGGSLHSIISETHADEDDGEDGETHELDISTSAYADVVETDLDRLPSPAIDESKGKVVTGQETTKGENDVSDGDIVKSLLESSRWVVGIGSGGPETDGLKDSGRVQTQSVEGNIESEPRPSSAKEYLEVLPLAEMSSEVGKRSLRQSVSSLRVLPGVEGDIAGAIFEHGMLVVGDYGVGVGGTPVNIGFDIDSVSGSLGNSQSEV
jgi:hypothetical protein